MKKSELALLNNDEIKLLRQTEGKSLKSLDEQELAKVHTRIRRARNKYSTLYRRQAARSVKQSQSRGKASAKNAGTSAKSEIFEDALVRVTDRMSVLAQQSAAELKEQRLAAARRGKGTKPASDGGPANKKSTGKPKGKATAAQSASLKSPKSKKNVASSSAAGARRQAKRDAK